MARKRRELEQFVFDVEHLDGVLGYMAELGRAADGWINLLPLIPENDKSTSLGFFTMFGGGSSGVTMCTWTPAHVARSGQVRATLGLTHLTARRAISQLQAQENGLPPGWTIAQDHPRRGLVVHIPADAPAEQVLGWAMRSIRLLSPETGSTRWRADVYLPVERRLSSDG